MSQKISPKLLAVTFSVLVLCFLATLYIFAWTEPSVAPPGGNVAAPLNVSSTAQTKAGNLTVLNSYATAFYDSNNAAYYVNPAGTGAAYSAIFAGRVGIGTTSPQRRLDVLSPSGAVQDIYGGVFRGSNFAVQIGEYFQDPPNGDPFATIQSSTSGLATRDLYINPEGGWVGIGTFPMHNLDDATVLDRPFKVWGTVPGHHHTAIFIDSNQRTGVALGGFNDVQVGSIQSVRYPANSFDPVFDVPLIINAGGGSVGIQTVNPGGALQVNVHPGPLPKPDNYLRINNDWNVGVELRTGTTPGTPYIDFSNDNTIDYDVRLILTGNDTLALQGGSHDIAEYTPSDGTAEAGDVVVIAQADEFKVTKSNRAYDYLVAGVYSENPGFVFGKSETKNEIPLTLAGRVLCRVTTENGPIKIGDILVTSSRPGYAMKANLDMVKPGMIVGKALEPLEKGEGKILILVD